MSILQSLELVGLSFLYAGFSYQIVRSSDFGLFFIVEKLEKFGEASNIIL